MKLLSPFTKEEIKLTREELQKIQESENYKKNYDLEFKKMIKKIDTKIYLQRSIWIDIMWLLIAALVSTIAFDYFINITGDNGIFPGGMSSIARLISIIISDGENSGNSSLWYFIIYLLINIPFIIFGFLKVGVKFTFGTLIYMSVSILFNIIITNMPIINPSSLSMLFDINKLKSNDPVRYLWLFIFAVFGGLIIGWAYAVVYKAGFSTGGTDFIGMFYSKKKNKNIGTFNRNINMFILVTVITINSLVTKNNSDQDFIDKFKNIFGPTLFASFVLVIIQTLVIVNIYPKFKVRTFLLSTTKEKEIKEYLLSSGYRNNVFSWDSTTDKAFVPDVEDKTMLVITMSVMNWRKLEKGILTLDKKMNIQSLKTSFVKGPFVYELSEEKKNKAIAEKINSTPKLIKKIVHIAVFKTIKEENKNWIFQKPENNK